MTAEDPSRINRQSWNSASDEYQSAHHRTLGDAPAAWGVWRIPEAEVGALPDVAGKDVLEFGCGAAQWSIALAQRGARCVGLDLSDRQLAHARQLIAAADVGVPLVLGSAECTPLADAGFDLVFCDHGAMTFARPELTVPEAARLLRPGGEFVFCSSTPLRDITWDAEREAVGAALCDDYFGLRRLVDEDSVQYQLPYGAWIRLFRRHGFVVEDLIELRPDPAITTTYRGFVSLDWARRWPAEHIWKLTKTSPGGSGG